MLIVFIVYGVTDVNDKNLYECVVLYYLRAVNTQTVVVGLTYNVCVSLQNLLSADKCLGIFEIVPLIIGPQAQNCVQCDPAQLPWLTDNILRSESQRIRKSL